MHKGITASTLAALCFSSTIVFVRRAYSAGINPGTAIFLRFLFGALALGVMLRLSGRWQDLPRRKIALLLVQGFLAYTVLGTTWFLSLSTTPAWLVALFGALVPLVVSLGSWIFLREAIHPRQALALLAVLSGGVLLFWQPFEVKATLGIWLMTVNILTYAVYLLFGQRYIRDLSPVMASFWMICGAAAGTFLYALLSRQLDFAFQPGGWLWVALFAVISTALAISFLWRGVFLLGAARATIVGSLEPLFSILLAVVILGEFISRSQMLGGGLVLLGVLLVQR